MRKNFNMLFKRVTQYLNSIHIKNKLLICYGILIILSVSIGGVFSYYNVQNYISKMAGESYQQTLEQVQMNIEYKLNAYDGLASQIISDQKLVFMLYRDYTESDYSYEYLDTIKPVFFIKEKDNNIQDVLLVKNNDTFPADGGSLLDISSVSGKGWFKKYFGNIKNYTVKDYISLSKKVIWFVTDEDAKFQEGGTNNLNKEKRVVILKPIIFNFEKLVGILELDVKYDAIFGEIDNTNSTLQDFMLVSDNSGNTIFSSIDQPWDIDIEIPEAANEVSSYQGSRVTHIGEQKVLTFQVEGKYSGWKYIRLISMGRLLESAKPIRSFAIWNGLISVVISFIIAILIANMISRRIAILSSKMEEVDDLTLDISVVVDGNDEIGKLAKSYNKMIKRIKKLVEESESSGQLLKEAEIRALQAQINPHFLYNALATINWMAMDNESKKIIAMVKNLSTFYRLSLNKGREYQKIGDEVSLTSAYTNIQKIRWEDKINITYDIEDNINDCYTLKLVLQPFVENAIIHGAEYKKNSITNIVIRGYKSYEGIILEVIDDGLGMKDVPKWNEYSSSQGYGIRNVHEKITVRFGSNYGVKIFSRLGIGTQVSICIPVIEETPGL